MGKTILLGVLIVAGGILGWQQYDSNRQAELRASVKTYVRSFNRYRNSEHEMLRHIIELKRYGGFIPDNLREPLARDVQQMLEKDGCPRIPDKTLRERCNGLFTQYRQSLEALKVQGFPQAVGEPLRNIMHQAHEFMDEVAAKYPDFITRTVVSS